MDRNVVDDLGLVLEGQFLTVFIPPTNCALVFRVISRANRGYEQLNFGLLPLKSGESLPTYEGASITVPEDGVLPARAYVLDGKSFPMSDAYDETDMWYTPEEYRNRLFHVIHRLTPDFLRADVQIPKGVTQGRFQKDKIITGVHKDWGFTRGKLEVAQIPEIHYGFRWGNDTNMPVYTAAEFIYAEYTVDIPKDAELLFLILTKKIPSYWISLPVTVYDTTIESALKRVYGLEGFKVYGVHQREVAIRDYSEAIRKVLL